MGEKKVANGVVALGSAAVLAVYGAGYAKTREAADRFAQQAAERRQRTPVSREDRQALTTSDTVTPEPAPASAAPDTPVAPPARPGPSDAAPTPTTSNPGTVGQNTRSTSPATPPPTSVPVAEPSSKPNESLSEAPVETTASATGTAPAEATSTSPTTPPPASVPAPSESAKAGYKDGTYFGWGTSRHGDIQAAVVIEDGRITVARVEQCLTRYSCSWITPIPPRILSKQKTTYDYVSGATESSDAFQDAVAEALAQAK